MATENFGEFLRRRRRELGLSQEDLADDAALSANYIAKLETGVREPGLKALMRLSEALEVSKDEIFNIFIHAPILSGNGNTEQEFKRLPPKIQSLLIEIGRILQKYP
jgi:transcriptional regulator with XRE-family HTH domain